MTPDVAVVISLNHFLGPADDTVTATLCITSTSTSVEGMQRGGERLGGPLGASAAGAGGCAWPRWPAAGPLIVSPARFRRAQPLRSLSWLLRPMLVGAGLFGAGRARDAAGAPACAGPGRAVAGGVRWGVRGACAGGVGARPRRGLRCRVSEGHGGSGYPGRRKGRWAYACRALTM